MTICVKPFGSQSVFSLQWLEVKIEWIRKWRFSICCMLHSLYVCCMLFTYMIVICCFVYTYMWNSFESKIHIAIISYNDAKRILYYAHCTVIQSVEKSKLKTTTEFLCSRLPVKNECQAQQSHRLCWFWINTIFINGFT